MAARWNLEGVRAVVFDAVGTLIMPDPQPAEVYAAVGCEFGIDVDPAVMRGRFREAFQREEDADRVGGWRTSPQREELRWRAIVAHALPEIAEQEQCFHALWNHFAAPASWRILPAARQMIAELDGRRLTMGVASNFDGRLRTVLAGLPDLPTDLRIVISAEVGWRKPAREFYAAVVETMQCAPHELVMVGDDRANDYDAAIAAGLRAVLVD